MMEHRARIIQQLEDQFSREVYMEVSLRKFDPRRLWWRYKWKRSFAAMRYAIKEGMND